MHFPNKGHDLPTFGNRADFGLFLGFASGAFGEELVHEGLFQFGGGLNDPLLRFDRPLHRRKDMRDLLLLGEWDFGKPRLRSLIGKLEVAAILVASLGI